MMLASSFNATYLESSAKNSINITSMFELIGKSLGKNWIFIFIAVEL